MEKIFSTTVNNLAQTEKLAQKFASLVKNDGAFVCLYGDIGAGKDPHFHDFVQNI